MRNKFSILNFKFSITSKTSLPRSGFTLVELIVVMAILGVLVSGLVVLINPVKQIAKGNDTRRKSDLASVQKALQLYYSDFGQYPDNIPGNHGFSVQEGGNPAVSKSFGSTWAPYMPSIPEDPKYSDAYVYLRDTPDSYRLFTHLESLDGETENCQPASAPNDDTCANATALSCGGKPCNFGMSSPNISP